MQRNWKTSDGRLEIRTHGLHTRTALEMNNTTDLLYIYDYAIASQLAN